MKRGRKRKSHLYGPRKTVSFLKHIHEMIEKEAVCTGDDYVSVVRRRIQLSFTINPACERAGGVQDEHKNAQHYQE